ncbi:hypothetical protein ANN_17112 [Periplaneta americana]|uniref:Reverse transcriptase domain-containing protein n=1 Tax=Periplaneta americana TaxID=6978 RepID=A0ABQ8SU49_PERAM|nr:hypothetical protein ANN_17112 [Periplaneta americana]
MSPGSSTESYPAFARIGLRENPGKNLNQVTCPDRDSNPGHLVSRPDALTGTPQIKETIYKKSITDQVPSKFAFEFNFISTVPDASGSEFQSLGRAIVKEDEYEEVRWDDIYNPSELWKNLKVIGLGRASEQADIPIPLDRLNEHFVKDPSLNDTTKQDTVLPDSVPPTRDKFYFTDVTPIDVMKAIRRIKTKAQGPDNISIILIQKIQEIQAFVLPLPKVKVPTDPNDYRPISILPAISKALERIVHRQITNYMNEHKLFDEYQSGFRAGHNTSTALLKVTEEIREAIDSNKVTILTLLDLSKAFNSVNFDLLTHKLRNIYLSETAVSWFESYLRERQQCVVSGNRRSSWLDITSVRFSCWSRTGAVISVHYGAGTVFSLAQFYPLDTNCAAGVGGGERIRVKYILCRTITDFLHVETRSNADLHLPIHSTNTNLSSVRSELHAFLCPGPKPGYLLQQGWASGAHPDSKRGRLIFISHRINAARCSAGKKGDEEKSYGSPNRKVLGINLNKEQKKVSFPGRIRTTKDLVTSLSCSEVNKALKSVTRVVTLPIVLYDCETWTLTLRGERTEIKRFENNVLKKLFEAKRDEVTGEIHNTKLHALNSSPDIIRNIKSRRLRWAEHVARMGEFRNAYRMLVRRPEGKIPLGRPRRRWEDNIKIDLREVEYDDREWINLAQDRGQWRAYVRAAMNLRPGSLKAIRRRPEGTKAVVKECDIYSLSSELKAVDNETASSSGAKRRRSVLKEMPNDKPNDLYGSCSVNVCHGG